MKFHKKHIIFDFDETLCTMQIGWDLWARDVKELIHSYDKNYKATESFPSHETQNEYVKKFGDEFLKKLIDVNRKAEKKYYHGYTVNKAAIDFLKNSTNSAKIYLWTSNNRETVLSILKELKITSLFEKIVSRNDVRFIKPVTDGFDLIYEGSPKSEYLFVGDSKADKGAAEKSGIDFVDIRDLT